MLRKLRVWSRFSQFFAALVMVSSEEFVRIFFVLPVRVCRFVLSVPIVIGCGLHGFSHRRISRNASPNTSFRARRLQKLTVNEGVYCSRRKEGFVNRHTPRTLGELLKQLTAARDFTRQGCPTPGELTALVAPMPDDVDCVGKHLDTCPLCRQEYVQIASQVQVDSIVASALADCLW